MVLVHIVPTGFQSMIVKQVWSCILCGIKKCVRTSRKKQHCNKNRTTLGLLVFAFVFSFFSCCSQGWQFVQLHGLLLHLLPPVCLGPHPDYRHLWLGNMVSWIKPALKTACMLPASFLPRSGPNDQGSWKMCLPSDTHFHLSVQILMLR